MAEEWRAMSKNQTTGGLSRVSYDLPGWRPQIPGGQAKKIFPTTTR